NGTAGAPTITDVTNTQTASSNKVDTVVSLPDPLFVGAIGTIQVDGHTGTVGASNIVDFTPAAVAGWPASDYEIIKARINYVRDNTGLNDFNTLLIPPAYVGAHSADNFYTALYYFRVNNLQPPGTAPPISPVGFITSGSPVK